MKGDMTKLMRKHIKIVRNKSSTYTKLTSFKSLKYHLMFNKIGEGFVMSMIKTTEGINEDKSYEPSFTDKLKIIWLLIKPNAFSYRRG